MRIDAWGTTDAGRVRESNEDALLVRPGLFAVADGLGGMSAGAQASATAVDAVSRSLNWRRRGERALRRALSRAHRRVRRLDSGQEGSLGSTLTLASIAGSRLRLAHVGDSRAYLLRGGELRQLTTDHSWVSEMVRSGRIAPEEAPHHPQRHILTQALGAQETLDVEFRSLALRAGDVLLLCTDGLTSLLSDAEIRSELSRPESARALCGRLVGAALDRGAPDNVSAIVIRVEAGGPSWASSLAPLALLGLTLAAGALALSAGLKKEPFELLSLAGWLMLLFFGFFLASRLSRSYDPVLLLCALTLTALGVILQLSISPERAALQLRWLGISLLLASVLLLALRDHRVLARYKYLTAAAGLLLLLSPIFAGVERFGAKLWLQLGPLSFQPGEIAKILLAIFFAAYLAERRELLGGASRRWGRLELPPLRHFGPMALMWGISLLILVFERDLGSSLLFFGLFASMLFLATGRAIYPALGAALFLLGAVVSYQTFGHVATRVDVWLNPWEDPMGQGYQALQSLFAIAGGGILGQGLGQGQPELLPAAPTDLIFSVLAEEAGLAGVAALLFLYILFLARGFGLAIRARGAFAKLLAAGLTTALSLQTLIIIAGVTGAAPLTGVTLPFVSYGGSSLLANYLLLALLLKIGTEAQG